MRSTIVGTALMALLAGCASVPTAPAPSHPKNIIFFLGDGMGMNTLTAARIYAVGEDGELTLDTLPESAFVKTFANDAQVTDSAASMSAYMTGMKVNNATYRPAKFGGPGEGEVHVGEVNLDGGSALG